MGIALAKLAEEDPTFKTWTDQESGQTIIAGMGELHLDIIVDRLKREFKVECTVGKPQVSYKETIRNTSRYELTKEGEEVLFYFENKIKGEVKQDMDDFLKVNNIKLRTENSVMANYYKSTASNDFEIDCVVKEGKNTLIELKLSAATEEMAEKMCDNWEKASKEIYEFAMKKLL